MKTLPISLPSKELPFNIEVLGAFTSYKYAGSFVVKVPHVSDMGKIGIEVAKLCGGIPSEELPIETALLFNAVAFLRVLLIDAPEWFTQKDQLDYGLNSVDPNVVIEVFNEAKKKVDGWYALLSPSKEGSESVQ
jgi:hypothetical protein